MIPDWLTQKLASPPEEGSGLHAWLFSCARQLHFHMSPEEVVLALHTATAWCSPRRQHELKREIRQAVNNSLAVAWTPPVGSGNVTTGGALGGAQSGATRAALDSGRSATFPNCHPGIRSYMGGLSIEEGMTGLYELWERSPWRGEMAADDWLDILFPGAEWLCLAVDHPATARSRTRDKWSFGPAEECGLVVPSPMTGPSGLDQNGERSHRCLGNTGPRRWLVVEFDGGILDEQAAMLWQVAIEGADLGLPMKLVVHSGSKSLHGWFGPCANEESAFSLMKFAVRIGADPATWNRCQLVRLPGGLRRQEVRQEVFYFAP